MYDYDPKFHGGDGGVEFRGKGSQTVVAKNVGILVTRTIQEIPYDGSEGTEVVVKVPGPTFGEEHEFTNRPA